MFSDWLENERWVCLEPGRLIFNVLGGTGQKNRLRSMYFFETWCLSPCPNSSSSSSSMPEISKLMDFCNCRSLAASMGEGRSRAPRLVLSLWLPGFVVSVVLPTAPAALSCPTMLRKTTRTPARYVGSFFTTCCLNTQNYGTSCS